MKKNIEEKLQATAKKDNFEIKKEVKDGLTIISLIRKNNE